MVDSNSMYKVNVGLFIKEKKNIKDFYKITSCIGRGNILLKILPQITQISYILRLINVYDGGLSE